MILSIIISSFIVSLLLIIWFQSDAYAEYCRLFHLNFMSFYKNYYIKKLQDPSISYTKYLKLYHNNFLIRLITCPICLSFWISIILSIYYQNIIIIPISTICGLLLYGLINKLLD